MSNNPKVLSFEEFHASWDCPTDDQPLAEALRQQRAFFRNPAAAEGLLKPGAINLVAWILWDNGGAKVMA
jgi:hypothetical protein